MEDDSMKKRHGVTWRGMEPWIFRFRDGFSVRWATDADNALLSSSHPHIILLGKPEPPHYVVHTMHKSQQVAVNRKLTYLSQKFYNMQIVRNFTNKLNWMIMKTILTPLNFAANIWNPSIRGQGLSEDDYAASYELICR